jgi:hypothetical protein
MEIQVNGQGCDAVRLALFHEIHRAKTTYNKMVVENVEKLGIVSIAHKPFALVLTHGGETVFMPFLVDLSRPQEFMDFAIEKDVHHLITVGHD